MPDYELDYTRHYDNGHYTNIAILTGLPIEEISAASPSASSWRGIQFIETFRKLGFNVNPRFIKFDRETPYPCLMRFKDLRDKERCWYAWVYYKTKVYTGMGCWHRLDSLLELNPHIKVTSMLQVWI